MIGAASATSDSDDIALSSDLTDETITENGINADTIEENLITDTIDDNTDSDGDVLTETASPNEGLKDSGTLKNSGTTTVTNWTELKNNINDGAIIELDGDDVYYAEESGINIASGTVTINGKGHTIDAKGLNCRIFEISDGATLILKNLTLKNCNSTKEYGGAIYNDKGTLTVTNCTFTNNTAGGEEGGAIYNYEGALRIEDSTFDKNKNFDKAIYNYGEEDNPFRLTIINTAMIEDKVCVNYGDNERRLDDKRDIDLLTTEVNASIPEIIYEGSAVLINVTGIDADFTGSVTVNITNTIYNTEVDVANGEGSTAMSLDINKYTARFKNFISLTEEAFERDDTKPYLEINFKVARYNSFTALNDEISKATDSISLSQDYIYDPRTDSDHLMGITIDNEKTLTIYGNGHSIKGSNSARLFQIQDNSNVRMENIILESGHGQRDSRSEIGGAILISYSNLTIINSTLKNNRVNDGGDEAIHAGRGGAIYASTDSILNITESKFINNTATYGRSLYMVEGISAYILNSIINEEDIANVGEDILAQITIINDLNPTLNIPNPVQGEDILFNITELENLTCIVNLSMNNSQTQNDIEIANGLASLNLDLEPGQYTATISIPEIEYFSDPDRNLTCTYLSSTVSKEFTVLKKVDIQLTVQNIAYGKTETITANIDADGNVTIKLNGKVIKNGLNIVDKKITYAIPKLAAGTYTVEVIYNGDEYTAKSSKSAKFTVSKANTTVKIKLKTTIEYGDTQTINITIGNSNATGNVTISLNGKKYTAKITKGVAKFTTPKLNSGSYKITVKYNGDKNFNAKQATATLTVKKVDHPVNVYLTLKKVKRVSKKVKKLYVNIIVKRNGSKLTTKNVAINVNLKDTKNKKLTVQNFKFLVKANGITYTQKTNKKGKATYKISKLYLKKAYTAKITYQNNKYTKAIASISFNVKK